jgi:hypothetical protein
MVKEEVRGGHGRLYLVLERDNLRLSSKETVKARAMLGGVI